VHGEGIHAYVAAAPSGRGAGIGIVFVDGHGHVLRRAGRRLPVCTTEQAAFQGVLYALWTIRRLGTRRVVVHADSEAVVAQINGDHEVDLDLIGPYLEVRALMHAYRSARVDTDQTGWGGQEARTAAEAALKSASTEVIIEDLPLWAGRVRMGGFSA